MCYCLCCCLDLDLHLHLHLLLLLHHHHHLQLLSFLAAPLTTVIVLLQNQFRRDWLEGSKRRYKEERVTFKWTPQ